MANTFNICSKLQAIADAITQGGGGGGGTTVIANPTGTPTADLDTVQIGNTIYDIPGSGGGGVGTIMPLYESSVYNATITLDDDLFDYDFIFVEINDGNGYKRGMSFAVDELATSNVIGYDNTYGYVWYTITDGTTLTNMARSNFFISSITGMDMGTSGAYTFDTTPTSGSSNPVTSNGIYDAIETVNSKFARLLWTNPSPAAQFSPTTITLSDDDYDALILVVRLTDSDARYYSCLFIKEFTPCPISVGSYARGFALIDSTDYTKLTINNGYNGSSLNNYVLIPQKIYGLKLLA